MNSIKEITHPLRSIQMICDSSKPEQKLDTQLLKVYVKMHDKLHELMERHKTLRKDFDEQRELYFEIKDTPDNLITLNAKLNKEIAGVMVKHSDYRAFKLKYEPLELEIFGSYNDSDDFCYIYDTMDEKFDEISDLTEKNKKDFTSFDTLWKNLAAKEKDFLLYPHKVSIDADTYQKDKVEFSKLYSGEKGAFDAFYEEVNTFFVEEFNLFMDNVTAMQKDSNKTFKQYHILADEEIKFAPVEVVDFNLVWFEFKKEIDVPESVISVQHEVMYDFEFDDKNNFILHLDNRLSIQGLSDHIQRISVKMNCPLQEVFTKKVLAPIVGRNLELMRWVMNEKSKEYKDALEAFDIRDIKCSYEVIDEIVSVVAEGQKGMYIEIEKRMSLYRPVIEVGNGMNLNLFIAPVLSVMDQLFFTNDNFDKFSNQCKFAKAMGAFSPYLTLKNALHRMHTGAVILSAAHNYLFLMLTDCVCQLLAGENDIYFYEMLDKISFRSETCRLFLKEAPVFKRKGLEYMGKIGGKQTLEDSHFDWNKIFFG